MVLQFVTSVYEFKRLVDGLNPYLISGEKIIVLGADQNRSRNKILLRVFKYRLSTYLTLRETSHQVQNHLLSLVETDYLFQIDADEQIPPTLLLQLAKYCWSRFMLYT